MAKKSTSTKSTSSKTPKTADTIDIQPIQFDVVEVSVIGNSPFICNRMSEKVQQGLLSPAPKKNAAAKASSLKHDVYREFRDSPYTLPDDLEPTLLAFLAAGFKGAIASAALDTPGAKKAQIGRIVRVDGERLPIYGVPHLSMFVVRSADMNRTPDIRTRAILPEWCCDLRITFPSSLIKAPSVINLLASAGQMIGVGDGRPEKGKLDYGRFRVVNSDDPELLRIKAAGGRDVQRESMKNPPYYNDESQRMAEWWLDDARSRGFVGQDRDSVVPSSIDAELEEELNEANMAELQAAGA